MTKRLTLIVCLFSLAVVGCSANAKSFWEESIRLSCKYNKKCEESTFNEYWDSISECREDFEDVLPPEKFEKMCKDYDRQKGADCLASMRKAIRNCDNDDIVDECTEVCGTYSQAVYPLLDSFFDGEDG